MEYRQKRTSSADPVAVIDIGSNSIRLVVYERPARGSAQLFNEKLLCALGRHLVSTGRLDPGAMERAYMGLRRFRRIAEQAGARRFHVIATAASRDAENGRDFIAKARKLVGLDIRVLDGREEAEYAAAGIAGGFLDPDGIAGDLGGGSLELVELRGAETLNAKSLQLGGLALIEKSGGNLAKARDVVERGLDEVPWLERGAGRSFFPIGGTWRTLARIHMNLHKHPLNIIHGYTMTREDVAETAGAVMNRPAQALEKLAESVSERAEVLPFGALVLKRVVERIQPSIVQVSAFGVREGLIYTLLPESERARDPLLAACEELAAQRSRSYEHARELCRWTDALFRKPGPKETPEERRLRYAACLLSDIAWQSHPDYRGEHSMGVIAQAGFAGIDHPGRAFLALMVYYRHEKGLKGELPRRLKSLAGRRWNKRAQIIGAAIRAIHTLSAGMPGVAPVAPIGYDENKLVLHLPSRLAALDGERLQRRLKTLAHLLNCRPEIRITGKLDAARAVMQAFSRRGRE